MHYLKPRSSLATPWLSLTLLSVALSSAYAQTSPAVEQDAGTVAAKKTDDGRTVLDTVTVSATRRKELIRDVPLAITKISTEEQLDLGAKDLTDVLQSVPGVTYNPRVVQQVQAIS